MYFMFFMPFGVFIVAFLFISHISFSAFKKAKKSVKNVVPTNEQNFNTQISNLALNNVTKPADKVCEYCGSTVPNGITECESCGAKVKK